MQTALLSTACGSSSRNYEVMSRVYSVDASSSSLMSRWRRKNPAQSRDHRVFSNVSWADASAWHHREISYRTVKGGWQKQFCWKKTADFLLKPYCSVLGWTGLLMISGVFYCLSAMRVAQGRKGVLLDYETQMLLEHDGPEKVEIKALARRAVRMKLGRPGREGGVFASFASSADRRVRGKVAELCRNSLRAMVVRSFWMQRLKWENVDFFYICSSYFCKFSLGTIVITATTVQMFCFCAVVTDDSRLLHTAADHARGRSA